MDDRYSVSLIGPERSSFLMVGLYAAGVGLTALATPLAVQTMVNTIAFGVLVQPLVVVASLLLAALLVNAGLRVWKQMLAERIQQRVFVRAALSVATVLPRLDRRVASVSPDRMARFLEIATVQKSLAVLLLDGISLVLQSAIGLVLLSLYHPALLALALFVLGGTALVVFLLGRDGKRTSIDESHAKYAVLGWFQDLTRNVASYNSTVSEAVAGAQTERLVDEYLTHRRAHFGVLLRQIVGSLALQIIAVVLLLAVGGWLVIQRQLTLGQLIAAELILTPVVAGLAKLGKQLESYYDLVASNKKLDDVLQQPAEPGAMALAAPIADGSLLVRSAVIKGGDRVVLDNLNLEIAAGESISIVGATGEGKTCLARALAGVRRPESGVIVLGGYDQRDVWGPDYRVAIQLVDDAPVARGTIAENVALGQPTGTAAAIRETLVAVGLGDRIDALPEGAQTVLADDGAPLSRGELISVAVARALSARPRLLILDGSLDALDATRAAILWRAIEAQQGKTQMTVVLLTTRDELAQQVARRYRLRAGSLTEVA